MRHNMDWDEHGAEPVNSLLMGVWLCLWFLSKKGSFTEFEFSVERLRWDSTIVVEALRD